MREQKKINDTLPLMIGWLPYLKLKLQIIQKYIEKSPSWHGWLVSIWQAIFFHFEFYDEHSNDWLVSVWQEQLSLNCGDGLDEDLKVAATGSLLLTQDLQHQDNQDDDDDIFLSI